MSSPRIAIASSIGGLKPFAPMVALIQELETRGLRQNIIAYAGSSGGSVFSALAAYGYTGMQLENILLSINSKALWEDWNRARVATAVLRTLTQKKLLAGFTGLMNGDRMREWLYKYLGHVTFEDLKVPLYISAFDINRGIGRIFGPQQTTVPVEVAKAVRGSTAIPFGFCHETIRIYPDNPAGESGYWDGGITAMLPLLPLLDEGPDHTPDTWEPPDLIIALDSAGVYWTGATEGHPWVSINDLSVIDLLERGVTGLAAVANEVTLKLAKEEAHCPIEVFTVFDGASMSDPAGTVRKSLVTAKQDMKYFLDRVLK